MRPLRRVEKLGCEARAMLAKSQTAWFWLWLAWLGMGCVYGWRSLSATDRVPAGPHPPPEARPQLSGNGHHLAFEVRRPGTDLQDLYVYQLETGQGRLLQWGHDGALLDDSSQHPSLDRSGRWLAFASLASNWVRDDFNGLSDIFLLDLKSDEVRRIPVPRPRAGRSSSYCPTLSGDARWLAFLSYGVPRANPVRSRNLCLYSVESGEVEAFRGHPRQARGPILGAASFSPNADRLAYSGFFADLTPKGHPLHFQIYSAQLENPGVISLLSSATDQLPAQANSCQPVLLDQECLFVSLSSDLVAGDTNLCHDIFVQDLNRQRPVQRLSLTAQGRQANDSSFEPCASRDGRWVAFTSYADNLLPGDHNGCSDVFLLDRQNGQLECLSQFAPGPSYHPTISEDGQRVAFVQAGQIRLWIRGQALRTIEVSP